MKKSATGKFSSITSESKGVITCDGLGDVTHSHGHSWQQKKTEICQETPTDLEWENKTKGVERARSCKVMSMVPGGLLLLFWKMWGWSWIGPRLLQLHVCATLMVGRWWRVVRRTQRLEHGYSASSTAPGPSWELIGWRRRRKTSVSGTAPGASQELVGRRGRRKASALSATGPLASLATLHRGRAESRSSRRMGKRRWRRASAVQAAGHVDAVMSGKAYTTPVLWADFLCWGCTYYTCQGYTCYRRVRFIWTHCMFQELSDKCSVQAQFLIPWCLILLMPTCLRPCWALRNQVRLAASIMCAFR